MVSPIPEGFNTVSAHLVVKGAGRAVDFYKKAFGAEEKVLMKGPDGRSVMHAELQFGNSTVMICDEWPGMTRSPESLGGTAVTVHLYVADADKTFNQAVAAGATPLMPPADMPWGDRFGKMKDPFGHEWSVATRKEIVTPEECMRRMAEWSKNQSCGKQAP